MGEWVHHGEEGCQMEQSRTRKRCSAIIHAASLAAGAAAGVAVIPGSDAVIIMPIQVAMVAALAKEFGIRPSESLIRAAVYTTLGQILGKSGASLAMRWIPLGGNLIRASVAASVTEGLGWMLVDRLEAGEPI